MDALDEIGLMREDLFIDYVDIEWGLRASAKGYHLLGVCAAKMEHQLGEDPLQLFGKKFPCRSPLRHYYLFRNGVRLYCETLAPLNWKIVDGFRLLLKYGTYALFAKPRHHHFFMMTKGILHGLLGRMGKFT